MTKKRTLTLAVALVAVMMIGVGLAAAQGPRSGGRGQSDAGTFGQNLRTQQQIQDPALHLQDPLQQQVLQQRQRQRQLQQDQLLQQRPGWTNGLNAQRARQMMNGGTYGAYAALPPFEGELPADVAAALLAGLADELHAYATYEAVLAQFGNVAPFNAILNAEANHATALQSALDYYGVDTSSVTPVAATLNVTTLAEACQIAAEAEIANFGLYDSWIDTVSAYPDLVQIFTNLRDASEFNHLPAFEACAG